MSGRIFISYRREDSAAWAGRLSDRLKVHFPSNQIFMDIDAIDPGVDFVEAVEEVVGACDVLIAVIGSRWLNSSDRRGRRRLDIAEDLVRLEIATALKRGIRVVPVLVEGAMMPEAAELPDDLKPLIRRNALENAFLFISSCSIFFRCCVMLRLRLWNGEGMIIAISVRSIAYHHTGCGTGGDLLLGS